MLNYQSFMRGKRKRKYKWNNEHLDIGKKTVSSNSRRGEGSGDSGHLNKLTTMIMSLPIRGQRGHGTLKQSDYYDHVATPKRGRGHSNKLITMIMSLPRRGGGTLKQADYYDHVASPKRGRDTQTSWLLWSCRYPEEREGHSNKLITMMMSLPRRGGGTLK